MAHLGAAVAVGGGEAGDGKAGHEKGVEDAVLDKVDAARGLALVVVAVVTAQRMAVEGGERGVVGDREEGGEDGFIEELGEGLAFLVAALTLAFETVAEHLVEEDGGGASGEDGGTVEGLGDGRDAEGFKVLRHRHGLVGEGLLIGKVGGGVGFKGLCSEEVHAIGGAGAGDDDEPGDAVGGGDACSFRGDEVVGLGGGLHSDGVVEDVGVLLEERGEIAEAVGPCGLGFLGQIERRAGGKEGFDGALDGEVGRGVLLLGANLLVGLDLEIGVESAGIAAVGGEPEGAGEGGAVVGEGEGDGGEGGVAVVAVGIVFGGGADADLDVGHAAAHLVGGGDGAEAGGDGDGVGVGDGVADEVRLRGLRLVGRGCCELRG